MVKPVTKQDSKIKQRFLNFFKLFSKKDNLKFLITNMIMQISHIPIPAIINVIDIVAGIAESVNADKRIKTKIINFIIHLLISF
jgi:hypothetical protein